MKSITLENPFSVNERRQLNRLYEHDGLKPFTQVINAIHLSIKRSDVGILEEKRALDKMYFFANIFETVQDLNLNNTFKLSSNVNDTHYRKESLKRSVERLQTLFEIDFSYNIDENMPEIFLTKIGPLECVLFNLIKNGIEHNNGETNVSLDINHMTSLPYNITHLPNGAENYDEFVGFHVSNKGEGFSDEKKLEDYITIQPEIGKSGFGLYFTGLIARVLQAPVNIESENGNTTVSFFQPIY